MINFKGQASSEHVLSITDDLPIRTRCLVHNGKVRSVYFLTKKDSQRLIDERGYQVEQDTELAVMVMSDRISAFDCIWKGEKGLNGVPGKGAALNAIAYYWFNLFQEKKLAGHHILEMPHPYLWVVQRAKPLKIEAIARQYLTGSLWRAYKKGQRSFGQYRLPDDLSMHQRLDSLLMTPSTKGIVKGLSGVPEEDDVTITRQQLLNHFEAFGFQSLSDIERYECLLQKGFAQMTQQLNSQGILMVDTKFELGYVKTSHGMDKLIYIDEVGTPDSSRLWDEAMYQKGQVIEQSKEGFRQFLLNNVVDKKVLLDANRMNERQALAEVFRVPTSVIHETSDVYQVLAKKITGQDLSTSHSLKADVIDCLDRVLGVIQ